MHLVSILCSTKRLQRLSMDALSLGCCNFSFGDEWLMFVKSRRKIESTSQATSWLYHATDDDSYLEYVTGQNGEDYAQWGSPTWFSWDNKLAKTQVLLSRLSFLKAKEISNSYGSGLRNYKKTAKAVMCGLPPDFLQQPQKACIHDSIVVEKEVRHSSNLLACPICYDSLTWTGDPGFYVDVIPGSSLQCSTCQKTYVGNQIHLDLTTRSGAKTYGELMLASKELFRLNST